MRHTSTVWEQERNEHWARVRRTERRFLWRRLRDRFTWSVLFYDAPGALLPDRTFGGTAETEEAAIEAAIRTIESKTKPAAVARWKAHEAELDGRYGK